MIDGNACWQCECWEPSSSCARSEMMIFLLFFALCLPVICPLCLFVCLPLPLPTCSTYPLPFLTLAVTPVHSAGNRNLNLPSSPPTCKTPAQSGIAPNPRKPGHGPCLPKMDWPTCPDLKTGLSTFLMGPCETLWEAWAPLRLWAFFYFLFPRLGVNVKIHRIAAASLRCILELSFQVVCYYYYCYFIAISQIHESLYVLRTHPAETYRIKQLLLLCHPKPPWKWYLGFSILYERIYPPWRGVSS